MKRIAFVIGLLTFTCSVVRAQQEYFLFILADNQQPFYVRLGEKTYPSSGIGHLVIPRLKDSSYNLLIGFPRKQYPEQVFAVNPNGKDLDYRLSNSDNDGWHLVNGQTAQSVKARKEEGGKTATPLGERKTGEFAVLMSGLVNDSAVMYKTVAKVIVPPAPVVAAPTPEQTIAAPATTTPVTATQTEAGTTTAVVTTPPATPVNTATSIDKNASTTPDSVVATPRSVILDVQEWWNEKGKGYIYYDSTLIGVDTISILVEYGPPKMINPNQAVDGPAKKDSVKAVITEDPILAQQAAAADSTRKQAETVVTTTAEEKLLPPVVPVVSATNTPDSAKKTAAVAGEEKPTTAQVPATTIDSSKQAQAVKPVSVTATDSVKLDQAVITTPVNTMDSAKKGQAIAIDSVKQAQATAAAKAKVDSVKAISQPVAKTPETVAPPAELPKKDSVKVSETTTASTAASDAAKKDSVKAVADNKKQLLLMNSDCVNFATESDVDKLRVKLLNTNGPEDRITAAKKIFKTKCFVTRYIRGLSELFPKEEDRFKFFDAAYPYVSDSGNFRTLIDLFTEDLWIARFKALVRM